MDNQKIKEMDSQSHVPSYGRFDVVLESGSGSVAYDAQGKKYIDFTAGIGVNSLGFSDEGWVKAVSAQAGTIQHTSNLYYNSARAILTEKLCALSGMGGVFMCNSGAEANECAIKIARKKGNQSKKNKIITLVNSFHGRTVTTLSATGQDSFHTDFMPFTEGFEYVEAGDISGMKKQIASGEVCGVMVELVQGEGGVVPLEKSFVKETFDLCKKNDILFMVDEVQTGIARTGTLFAFEQFDIKPDVVTLAKGLGGGLPIGACLCSEELKDVLSAGSHGSTFGGNPICCAGAIYVLDTVSKKDFLISVEQKAEHIKKSLLKMAHVKGIYGMGLMIGIQLEDGYNAGNIATRCGKNGLLVLTAKTRLRLLPPLNISYREINEGLEILGDVLSAKKI